MFDSIPAPHSRVTSESARPKPSPRDQSRWHSRAAKVGRQFAGALPVALLLGLSGPAAAEPGDLVNKHFERSGSGGMMCAPKGTLKELQQGKYKCRGHEGASVCEASFDAVQGKLDESFFELFKDLLQTLPAEGDKVKAAYKEGCADYDDIPHTLAFGVLSYAQKNVDEVVAYGATPNAFASLDGTRRKDFINALGRFGKADWGKVAPLYKQALETRGNLLEFKQNALRLMARQGSDDGVAYCMNVLKKGDDKAVTRVCAWYLAERGAKEASDIVLRNIEGSDELWFQRAAGLLGAQGAVDVLKPKYEKDNDAEPIMTVTAALLNLGDKSHDYAADMVSWIKGRRPLSLEDREKKAADLKDKKKKGAADSWKKREEQDNERAAKAACIEATYIVNKDAAKKIDEALRATAKRADWPEASAMAWGALAQRGDKAAVAELAKLLNSPKEDVRKIALDQVGARYEDSQSFPQYQGRVGIVVDASLLPALAAFYENEQGADLRELALQAMGAIRGGL